MNVENIESYLTESWTDFMLAKNGKLYFQNAILTNDLLIFSNHNLFSKYPLKCLESNIEHHFKLENDSLFIWFGGMGILSQIKIPANDSTYILFPKSTKKKLTIIQQIDSKKYLYTYYQFSEDNKFSSLTKIKSRNKFKHTLGIRNKKKLELLLFKNVDN